MENFTPVSGFLGGLLIGAASLMLLMLTGRIAGISGILGGALAPDARDRGWRFAFLAGLVLGPLAVALARGALPEVNLQTTVPGLVIAGLLVGYGTRLGSGCTSGHGVCGLARLSGRSLAATAIFIGVAAATVFVLRHVIGS